MRSSSGGHSGPFVIHLADELDVLVGRHDRADPDLHTIDSERWFQPP